MQLFRFFILFNFLVDHVDTHADQMQVVHYPIGAKYESHTDW